MKDLKDYTYKDATPAGILRGAADLIEECGHVKGQAGDEKVGFCVVGALGRHENLVASGTGTNMLDVTRAGAVAIRALTSRVGMNIVDWNDNPRRRATTIVKTMREVADQLDAKALANS